MLEKVTSYFPQCCPASCTRPDSRLLFSKVQHTNLCSTWSVQAPLCTLLHQAFLAEADATRSLDLAADEQSIDTADAWAMQARSRVLADTMRGFSPTHVMTVLLLQRYENRRGRHSSEWLLTALAVRMCFALQLNVEFNDRIRPDAISSIRPRASTLETHRRLAWAVFMMDSKISGELRQISRHCLKRLIWLQADRRR